MGLVVQHNITALNANRQLGVTAGAQAKSTEKLSSGYKINRAGDDAAGLTISEKMRSQIRGLDKASTNAQDGISLIQSAEGALNEAHSILQRMNELAVQGANDTNQTIDRDAVNEELDALTEELNRIAKTTQFNKQELLDGSFAGKNLQVGANAGQSISISIDAMNASALGLTATDTMATYSTTEEQKATNIKNNDYDYSIAYTVSGGATASNNISIAVSNVQSIIGGKTSTDLVRGKDYIEVFNGTSQYMRILDEDGAAVESVQTMASVLDTVASVRYAEQASVMWNTMSAYIGVSKWDTKVQNGTREVAGVKVDDFEVAGKAIDKVQNAINVVSKQRSALGALQNRLEHTVANLDTVSENTSAAESRIRDTDMAKEMVNYSKNNILAQAGQSMLAQANQSTQGILSLLQ